MESPGVSVREKQGKETAPHGAPLTSVINIGVIGDDPIALVLLGLLGRAGLDPILIALHSAIAERLQCLGLRLTGVLRATIERYLFTICREDLDDLPDRGFDYVIVTGENDFKDFVDRLHACPSLFTSQTTFVVVQNEHIYQLLLQHFPGRVFRAFVFGDFTIVNPQTDPRIETRLAAPMILETDENNMALKALTEILGRAGMAVAVAIKNAGINIGFRTVLRSPRVGTPISSGLSTKFVQKKNYTPLRQRPPK